MPDQPSSPPPQPPRWTPAPTKQWPTPAQGSPAGQKRLTGCGCWLTILGVVMIVAIIIGNAIPDDYAAPAPPQTQPTAKATPATTAKPAPTKPQADGSTELSCTHFRNVMGDLDVLTVPELRAKLQEVHSTGRLSSSAAIRAYSRAMLAAVTADDGEALVSSAKQFSDACRRFGL